MTRTYKFFASADPDAPTNYNQATFAKFLAMHFADGIFDGAGNNLAVAATDPTAMTVTVDTGAMMIQGYMLEGTGLETLSIAAADTSNPRYDRVVVRLDTSVNLDISYAVLTGTPASTPVVPTLTQTAYIYEVALATILVAAGVTSIVAGNITDERVYRDVANLYHQAVEMLAALSVAGNLAVTGDLAVTGNVALHGVTTIDYLVGNIAGDLGGYLMRDYAYTTNSADTLIIPASTGSLDYYIPNPIISGGLVKGTAATNDGSMHLTADAPYSHTVRIYITCYDASEVELMTDMLEAWGDSLAKDVVIPQATKHIIITNQILNMGSVSSSAIYCKYTGEI